MFKLFLYQHPYDQSSLAFFHRETKMKTISNRTIQKDSRKSAKGVEKDIFIDNK